MADGAESKLLFARAQVERACELLISPVSMPEDCSALLGRALLALTDANREISKRLCRNKLREPVLSLHAAVRRASRLLVGLDQFQQGWELRLGALCSGYTAEGKPGPVSRPG